MLQHILHPRDIGDVEIEEDKISILQNKLFNFHKFDFSNNFTFSLSHVKHIAYIIFLTDTS